MDKPISMSVKDFLIRKLAVQLMTSEKMIETVVNHQFQSANEAMGVNNSLEVSGFGKFFFNQKKAKKRLGQLGAKIGAMDKILASEETTDQRRHAAQVTKEKAIITMDSIKSKIVDED